LDFSIRFRRGTYWTTPLQVLLTRSLELQLWLRCLALMHFLNLQHQLTKREISLENNKSPSTDGESSVVIRSLLFLVRTLEKQELLSACTEKWTKFSLKESTLSSREWEVAHKMKLKVRFTRKLSLFMFPMCR